MVLEGQDYNNKLVRLTKKQYNHIIETHPELEGEMNKISKTVESPEVVRLGNKENIFLFYRFFEKTQVTNKYLVLVVKYLNGEGFIITAYFTSKIRSSDIIWRKK